MFDHQLLDFGAQLQHCMIVIQENIPFKCDQHILNYIFVNLCRQNDCIKIKTTVVSQKLNYIL